LDERFRAMFGRWDLERDRPEGGRGLERPWVNGVGELLRAYYALQRARTEEQSILRAEEELERASELLDEVTARVRDAETLVADHASAFDAVSRLPSIERELETQRLALADVRAAVRRWPVLEEEIVRTREQLAAAEHDAAAAEQRLGDASVRRREAEERARFLRAREARQARDAARQRLDAIAPVDPEALAQLREAERRRSELRAKLSVGTLRVTLRSASGAAVSVRLDGEGPREVRIAEAGEQRLEAHRRVGVSAGDLTVDVETGDEPFEELRGRHDATEQDVAAIAAAIGAADAEEASARAGERSAAERELRELQRRLDEVLGETSWDVLAAQFDGAGTQPGTIEGDAPADDRQLARDLADARMRVGELRSGVRNLERERASLVARFESQDALEDRLAEIRVRVGELESQRAEVPAIPSGFASAQAFLSAYERTRDQLPRLREERHAAREAQVDLLARQPEQSGEEAREAVDLAEAEYDRVRKQADALIRLREATAQTLAEQRDDPFEPFARLVGRYLEIASGSRYRALPAADPLAPERYARETGPELDFELLSQGTRDMVALAVRLALAQSSAGAQSAPLLLDDPLVDMDPERRTNAVRAIEAYASGSDDPQRQVLIFTCHPDHADLFRGATRVELG
ncbi:MAG: ATP-binding protein, partial [Spirochaetota bacterium]